MTIKQKQQTLSDTFLRMADVLAGSMTPGRLRAAVRLCAKLLDTDRLCLLDLANGSPQRLIRFSRDDFQLGSTDESLPDLPLSIDPDAATVIRDLTLAQALFGSNTIDDELTLLTLTSGRQNGGQALFALSLRSFVPVDLLVDIGELLLPAAQRCLQDLRLRAQCRELGHVLNFSDSLYASWNENEGWRYDNVNSILSLGYHKDSLNLLAPGDENPMHAADWEEARPLFRRALQYGEGYEHDYRAMGKNGEQHWFHAVVNVTEKNINGGARQLISLSQDVSKLRLAAEEAMEKAELEQWLVAQTNAVFSYSDLDSLSHALREMGSYLGMDRCTIRVVDPETTYSNLLAEWQQPELATMSELFPDMRSLSGAGWIGRLAKPSEAYIVNNVKAEVEDEVFLNYYNNLGIGACLVEPMISDNQLIGYLNLLHTNERTWSEKDRRVAKEMANAFLMTIMRVRLLDELRTSDERFQLAMEHSTYGLWDRDAKNGTIFYSPHFYEQLGFPRKDNSIPLAHMLHYIHPDDHRQLHKLYQFHGHSDTIDLELRHVKKDGSVIWMLSRGKVVERDDAGAPQRVIGVNLDITEHKNIQIELAAAQQVAEEANRNKSEFLERMSHEIRTPMNAIMGMTYLALTTELTPEQHSYLTDMDAAEKSLLHIIDDILDFSKIEAGELTIVNQQYNLHEEVERLTKLHRIRAEEGNNELHFHVANDIPTYVSGDKYRLGQVLTNLIGNAVKFTSGGRIDVAVRLADTDNLLNTMRLLFTVTDTGIGLSNQQLSTLFEPFAQADGSTNRKYGGTGLGLFISKYLVERMGGSIHCRSTPDVGTTFEFSVVLKQCLQPDLPPSKIDYRPIAPTNISQPLRRKVLLVEDNLVNQRVASGILRKLMIDSVAVNNGAEAVEHLEQAEATEFDAVLMDIEMPVLDGLAATRAIRQQARFQTLPIIAMTAHAMVGDRERCLAAGMNEHIAKPVNPDTLLRVLNQFWTSDELEFDPS